MRMDVIHRDEGLLGTLYLDLFSRDQKMSGAAQFTLLNCRQMGGVVFVFFVCFFLSCTPVPSLLFASLCWLVLSWCVWTLILPWWIILWRCCLLVQMGPTRIPEWPWCAISHRLEIKPIRACSRSKKSKTCFTKWVTSCMPSLGEPGR